MKNKYVLITGANSGIGKAAAKSLAIQGANIIMVCRNKEKGEKARREIIDYAGHDRIDLLTCDLASQKQIRQLAKQVLEKYERLDVLLNNAGLISNTKQLTEDGLEYTFAVNHIAYFLLTNLLLDLIVKTPRSRIVNVSSTAHKMIREIDYDNLQAEKSFDQWQTYSLSKLCNIFFTYTLAEQLKDTDTTVNCLHPGVVNTGFGANLKGWMKPAFEKLGKFLFITPEKGAATSIYLSASPQIQGITGKYWNKRKQNRSSKLSYNKEDAQKIWTISEQLCGQSFNFSKTVF